MINQFGYLKNTGVNLSARFIFTIDMGEENDNKSRVLRIEHSPDYIPAFFEKSNITNVTAIIGKNGAVKSSILNYIKSHLPQDLEANVDNDIFAYSFGSGNDEKFILVYPEAYQLTVDDQTTMFVSSAYYQFPNTPSYRDAARLSDADYIYYSFFFDFKREEENWSGLHDISTGALLQAERRQLMEENINDEDTLHQKMTYSSDMDRSLLQR